MTIHYELRIVCTAKAADGAVLAQSAVEVKHETYETLVTAARAAKRQCQLSAHAASIRTRQ